MNFNRIVLGITCCVLFFCLDANAGTTPDVSEADLTNKLLHFVKSGKLHKGVKEKLEKAGEADLILVFRNDEANAAAQNMKARIGSKVDDDNIVKEKSRLHGKKKSELLAMVPKESLKVLTDYTSLPVMYLKTTDKSVVTSLLERPEVVYIGDNLAFTHKVTESIPLIGVVPGNGGISGSGTSVAVLDTVVDYTLPAFGSCSSPGIPIECRVSYAQNFTSDGTIGNNGHGSNVAGIITGVAPDAKILALNVFRTDGFAYEADVIKALDWVLSNRTEYNIVAVNLSLGTGKYSASCPNLAVAKAIDDLRSAGIAIVIPSGNNGFSSAMSYPACSPGAISVGAVYDSYIGGSLYWQEANCTDSTSIADIVPCFSNSNPSLTMLAPGAAITAAGIPMSGTSQAAAHVSGAIALLKNHNPLLSVDDIVTTLTLTGALVTDPKSGVSKPRLNVDLALASASAASGATEESSEDNSSAGNSAATKNGGPPTDGTVTNGAEAGSGGLPEVEKSQGAVPQIAGPGWFMGTAPVVSPEAAREYFNKEALKSSSRSRAALFTAMSATDATPEIAELARALRNDPKLIYDYVHNNINYVPYFGSLKGATLTYLDGSGNDFDQATLMIALLRASGYTAQYVYGKMTIPGTNVANLLGVDINYQAVGNVIASGGIPVAMYNDATAQMDRVWVKATIGGTDYLFDPAFKTYSYSSKIDIPTAMGYSQTDFLAGATSSATVGTDYVQNLNETNIRTKLATYANNLVATIRSQHANKSIEEIIGGRNIVQSYLTQYTTTLPFSPTVTYTWDDVPTTHVTTIRVQHVGIDYTANSQDLSGKRLTLTYAGADNHPELRLDGTLLASGTATTLGSKNTCTIIINHPYAANSGTYVDQTVTYSPESGRNYAIVYNFGGVSDTLLQKRQQQLESYRTQGLADTTEAVLGETLHIMGITWLKEVMQSMNLLSAIAETVPIMHHNIGFMCQEAGYYIDVKAGSGSILSRHNIDADRTATFKVFSLVGSAFEHGILEQLMGSDKPGVSTMKLFQIANSTNRKVYLANSTNYSVIRPLLANYATAELDDFQSQVNSGRVLVLPDNGQLVLNQWKGNGYISKDFNGSSMSMGMIIGGDYYGGYAATPGTVSTPTVTQNTQTAQITTSAPATVNLNISTVPPSTSKDPVDMAGGSFLFDRTDLALGGAAPLGLGFSRSYTSADAMTRRSMGYGWSHTYDIWLTPTSHGEPGLGLRQPLDAAAMIAALYVGYDLLKNYDTPTAWMSSSLASKWAIDQVIDNAMVVHIGKKVMEFVKLADGTYASPPGITTKLIKNGDGTFSLVERFGSRINFNSNKQASQILDADGNTQTFTYSGTTLSSVRDAFNRTLTFGYDTSSRLASVTDSTGRSVTFGYNATNDLTTFIDPENKSWGYGYDVSHRMTTLTNPLTITTATNVYDSLGRVKTQTVPRQGTPGTNATYNFYFSGFRNSEVDPSGNATTYYYDRKGREFAVENALGQKSTKQFDGQDHVVQSIDPRSNTTTFLYDKNNNLTRITDPFSKATNKAYDTLFRLTDSTDPLNQTTHYDYDSKHHVILARNGAGDTNTASYDVKGLQQTATDGRSTQTVFTYDGYGNPLTAKTEAHPAITYAYDPIGRMTRLTDQIGSQTAFTYDKRNLTTQKTDPLGKTTSFTYNNAGQLITKADRNGATVSYSYTPSGKLGQITYPAGSPVTFTYNLLDQLTAMQDGTGTTSYAYDAAGRLTSQTNSYGFTVSYSYDAAGNLTALTYPGNKAVAYTYDALNRLKTVTNWLSQTATYTYDDAGRLTGFTGFNGIATSFGYDAASRITSINNPIADYSFTLDGNGNRTGETRSEPLVPSIPVGAITYSYNTKRNRLLTAGSNSFGYNNEGQLTSGYGTSYTFDYEHRLTGGGGASYSYDGSGNRLQAVRSGVTTRYIYDAGGNLLAEADGTNTITRYYVYGAGLLAMVTPANQVYNYHYNATGSTIAITDQSQTQVNKYAYDPFGNIANQLEAIVQPFKYVGQFGVMSESNGFYYMKARYYDPNVGRFISEDPIGFDGGDVNLMAYVQNNPINRVDPSGLFWFRQDWQTDFVVGRDRTPVTPGGAISRFIEDRVPAGRTFGDLHDGFVDAATSVGIPDAVANIPSMIPVYAVALGTEVLRTLGILNQPTPAAQTTTTRQPTPCK